MSSTRQIAPRLEIALLGLACLLGGQGTAQAPTWTTTYAQRGAWYGYSVRNIGDVNADGYTDVMVGAPSVSNVTGHYEGSVFAYYGGPSGLSTTASWRADGDGPSVLFGREIAGIGDVNGDSIDDVAVAAMYENGGAGAVFVWYGQANTGLNGGVTGTSANAVWRCDGVDQYTNLGHSIAATDVNGDGINDLIVGAPGYFDDIATLNEGAVFIWYGSTSGLNGGVNGDAGNADWMVEGNFLSGKLGITVAAAGDMNDDGIGDFAIAAEQAPGYPAFSGFVWVFHGSPGGPAPGLGSGIPVGGGDSNSGFGQAMVAGDFDYDGVDELAIGIPGYKDTFISQGAVTVMKGASPHAVWLKAGESHGEQFGSSLATGDYDADGLDDLLVGSPIWIDFDAGIPQLGQVNLFRGDAMQLLDRQPVWTHTGAQSVAEFGHAVAMADVNGDGSADRLVSTPFDDGAYLDQGAAWMWPGVAGTPIVRDDCVNPSPDLTIEAPVTGRYRGHFGRFTANAGDVNGDGIDDVIVGAPDYGASEGAVFVFHGGLDDGQGNLGLDPDPAFTFSDPSLKSLGISVAAAGDVNGDGFGDVIVGATGWGGSLFQYVPGGAWLFYGGPNGLDASDPAGRWNATSPLAPDQFGFSVAGVGDVNDDGFDDIMVGAIGYRRLFSDDPFQDILPRVYLWFGGPAGPANGNPGIPGNADWFAESDQLLDGLGRVIAAAGDLDDDGYADVVLGAPLRDFNGGDSDAGMIWTYRGSAMGLNGGEPGALGFPGDADDWYTGAQDGENLGWSLSSADLNADGFSDLIIGSPGYSGGNGPRNGKVTLLWGVQGPITLQARGEVSGDRPYAFFGFSVAGTRDANGDGIDDYLIGAWRLSNDRRNQGRVYLYLGDPGSVLLFPRWMATGSKAGELLGSSVAGADVNADGIADLLAGSPYHDLPPNHEDGLLTVWHGGTETNLTATPEVVFAFDTVTFQHLGGRPFSPVVLAVVDINGTPVFSLIAQAWLDQRGCWSPSLQVPPGLAGLDLTFMSFSLDGRGNILSSNPALVQCR